MRANSPMSSCAALAFCAALTFCAAPGCSPAYDPCFQPASLISDLRILAVRADPPEVVFEPGAPPPAVRVQTLVVHPDPLYPSFVLNARLCVPPQPQAACPDQTPIIASRQGSQKIPPVLSIQVSEALLAASLAADPLHGYAGVRVQLDLEVPGETVSAKATKQLIFSPRAPGLQPNHALEVNGVTLLIPQASPQTLVPKQAIGLNVGTSIGLLPVIGPGDGALAAAEEYDITDLSGRTVHLRERISYSFFTTPHLQYGAAGQPVAGADQGVEPEPGAPAPPAGVTQMVPLSESMGRFWVVARDGRGAVAWSVFTFMNTDLRVCGNPVQEGGPTNHCSNLETTCG